MKFLIRRLRVINKAISLLLVTAIIGTGCRSSCKDIKFNRPNEFRPIGTQIEYTDTCVDECSASDAELEPHTLTKAKVSDFQYRDVTLEEAVQTALANSTVMRDLGARVLLAPQGASTVYDPALTQMNSGFGEEAALSAFDAQWATGLIFNRSERAFNNTFFGGGATSIGTNTAAFQTQVSKFAATGTQFAFRNTVDYNRVNTALAANVVDNSTYDMIYEAEVRHPLLRGGGITFNRIAGPNSGPGSYRGIIIARINTDIALADFETSVRDFVREVYNSYWQLYFAYQDLDAQRAGLEAARESWRTSKVRFESGAADAVDQAVAEKQFHSFERQVQNALSGSIGRTGILTAERDLRLLMGIQMNDGLLLRPSEAPTRAETVFDWYESLTQGLSRRVEIRRQKWTVKASEYQLLASRNQLLPQLDLLGQYRWRGFGSELLGTGSAYDNFLSGDLQGWQLGVQMSTPIGNRIGHVAVREAELNLARNRALLKEQYKYLVKDLSDAFGELSRSYETTRTLASELTASIEQARLRQDRYEAGTEILQFLVQAQSDVATTRSALVQSLVSYNIAIADLHFSRGTLLDFLGVELAEGGWSRASYRAAQKEARRFQTREMNYCYTVPCPVSRGQYPQHVLPRDEFVAPVIQSTVDPSISAPVPSTESPAEMSPVPADVSPVPAEFNNVEDLGI